MAVRRNASPSRKKSTPKFAPLIRTAFSSMAWKIGSSCPAEELMTRNTSAVAFSRSSASSRSRQSRADSLSARIVLALRRFSIALRLRALVGLLLALERRRIAHPKGLGLRRFSKWHYSRDLRPAKWDSMINLRSLSALSGRSLIPKTCDTSGINAAALARERSWQRLTSPPLDSGFWEKIETDPP